VSLQKATGKVSMPQERWARRPTCKDNRNEKKKGNFLTQHTGKCQELKMSSASESKVREKCFLQSCLKEFMSNGDVTHPYTSWNMMEIYYGEGLLKHQGSRESSRGWRDRKAMRMQRIRLGSWSPCSLAPRI
jgi:hypothetical protein